MRKRKLDVRRRRKASLLVDLLDPRTHVSTVRVLATGDIGGAPFTVELGGSVEDPAIYVKSTTFAARLSIPELVDSLVLAHRAPDDD